MGYAEFDQFTELTLERWKLDPRKQEWNVSGVWGLMRSSRIEVLIMWASQSEPEAAPGA